MFSGTSVGGGKRQEKGKGRKGKFGWIETVCACSGRLLSGRAKRGGVWLLAEKLRIKGDSWGSYLHSVNSNMATQLFSPILRWSFPRLSVYVAYYVRGGSEPSL